ncbi:hypothetical protein, partial [Chromobacterium haemolyticum]|uniref:hypothetical protein n=1 Tax=Chromobacterium haemolyticum TaxID=394935 RepID=UPI001962725F
LSLLYFRFTTQALSSKSSHTVMSVCYFGCRYLFYLDRFGVERREWWHILAGAGLIEMALYGLSVGVSC